MFHKKYSCNGYIESFKILFEASSQACFATVTIIRRPGFRCNSDFCWAIFVAFDAGDKPVGLFANLLLTKTIEGREVNLGLFLGVPELEFNSVSKFTFSGRLSNCTCKYRTTDRAHVKQDVLGIEALFSNGFPKSTRQSTITTYLASLF